MPGEDDISGLKRLLDVRLAPPATSTQFDASHGVDNEWEIGDCLAQWWRPNFETFMVRDRFSMFRVLTVDFASVSLYSRTYHQAQGMQKIVCSSDARAKYVFGALLEIID
jgi:hypothetical protein